MTDIKQAYIASVNVACVLTSLATDTTQLVGRASDLVDNSSTKALDYGLAGTIMTGTTPTTGKEIRVYVAGLMNDTTWPAGMTGSDSNTTITSAGSRDAALKIAAVISTNATSNTAYFFGPVSVASLFGGTLPLKFAMFVTHNTGVNLHATAGNHVISVTGSYETAT